MAKKQRQSQLKANANSMLGKRGNMKWKSHNGRRFEQDLFYSSGLALCQMEKNVESVDHGRMDITTLGQNFQPRHDNWFVT